MRRSIPQTLLLAGLAAFSFGCRPSQPGLAGPNPTPPASSRPADQANASLLPDSQMTPGVTLPVTRDDICVPGYTKKVRNVPVSVKRQVYAEYGIPSHKPGDYEVDHLISLELGGSNSVKNLWPQSYRTQPWNARVKDALENQMHSDVCSGKVEIATAQHEIATDWVAAYKKYFHTNVPLSMKRGNRREPHPLTDDDPPVGALGDHTQTALPGNAVPTADAQVWVNLKSGKYFHPGSSHYGKTKQGQYMTEAQARRQGYVAAKGQ